MKINKITLFICSLMIAVLLVGTNYAFALQDPVKVDCSVKSSKICVKVANGPYTTTYYGEAKSTSKEIPDFN